MSVSRLPKEVQSKVFELTLALYRVTDFFPEGEALRRNLRQKANEILGSVAEYSAADDQEREALAISARIQTVHTYLGVARAMRFVKPINLTVLEREYHALEDFFTRELDTLKTERFSSGERKKETPPEEVRRSDNTMRPAVSQGTRYAFEGGNSAFTKRNGISDRQKAILAHIETQKQARISDFFTLFDRISSKTIQRDLQDLVSRELLKKEGEKRWTIYTLNVR